MIIAGVIIVILVTYILSVYNKLVKLSRIVKQSEAGIDIYLKQRFDLIPNLVECVKGYSSYEKTALDDITKARADYRNGHNLKDAEKLNRSINNVMAVAEAYPELKASEQYLSLQNSLIKMESQLQAARRIYNNDVTKYNTLLETIPQKLVAKLFAFEKAELFQMEVYAKKNIDIESELN